MCVYVCVCVCVYVRARVLACVCARERVITAIKGNISLPMIYANFHLFFYSLPTYS